jgi:tetratricopeptide (TPR) repeat protein
MLKKSALKKQLSTQEIRDLDIEIGFIEEIVKRDPQFVDAWKILGDDYTRRGRFAEGLKVDERLSRLRPDDALVQYNLACSYSLTEQYDQAAAALERALDLGYCNFKWLARDPDLHNLRKHPVFKNIRDKLKSLKQGSR